MLSFTVHDLLAKNVEAHPDRTAVTDGDVRVSYGTLHDQVEGLAGWLHERGVRRGDRVCIQLTKSAEELVAIFAAARLGAVFVNVSPQRTVDQLAHNLTDSGSRVLFTEGRRVRKLAGSRVLADLEQVVVLGETDLEDPRLTSWEAASAGPAPEGPSVDRDLAALLYTSGSTGPPKGVMVTHRNLVEGARSVVRYLGLRGEDRILSLLPLSFDYGLNQILASCLVGGQVVLQRSPLPPDVTRTVDEAGVTCFAGVPPVWVPLVRHLRSQAAALETLRCVTNSGGAVPSDTLDAFPGVFPNADIVLMYGLTEAFRSTYVPPGRFREKKGAIGVPVPGVEVFVLSPQGDLCGPGESGELVHRGAFVSKGYWNAPDASREVLRPCPALADRIGDEVVCFSGDIVRMDEDGYLWFVGRRDEVIKCSGVRISPTEVEDVLHASGQVGEAVVFGWPHHELGQVVHAAVSVLEGRELDVSTLLTYCRRNMPSYMVPRMIHQWEGAFPRTGNGKLDRPRIVARYRDGGRGPVAPSDRPFQRAE